MLLNAVDIIIYGLAFKRFVLGQPRFQVQFWDVLIAQPGRFGACLWPACRIICGPVAVTFQEKPRHSYVSVDSDFAY